MPAHMAGPAGSPQPATRNEARLQAENARLREVIDQIIDLLDTSPVVPPRVDLAAIVFQVRRVIDTLKRGTTDG